MAIYMYVRKVKNPNRNPNPNPNLNNSKTLAIIKNLVMPLFCTFLCQYWVGIFSLMMIKKYTQGHSGNNISLYCPCCTGIPFSNRKRGIVKSVFSSPCVAYTNWGKQNDPTKQATRDLQMNQLEFDRQFEKVGPKTFCIIIM